MLSRRASQDRGARRGSVPLRKQSQLNLMAMAPRARPLAACFVVSMARGSAAGAQWCWVRDDTHVWVPGCVVGGDHEGKGGDGGPVEVEFAGGETRSVPGDAIGHGITDTEEMNQDFDDMVKMSDVDPARILHNLRLRFDKDGIYTNIGGILVSINPFKWMDHLYV